METQLGPGESALSCCSGLQHNTHTAFTQTKAVVILLRLRIALSNCVTMETPWALIVLRRGAGYAMQFPARKTNKVQSKQDFTQHFTQVNKYKRDK